MADRRSADDLLTTALAGGMTDAQAAAACGLSTRTVRRRRGEAAFMKRVRRARAELVSNAAGKLADAMAGASETLVALLADPDPAIRLKASDKILSHGLRAAELVSLEERVSELEGDHDGDTEGESNES